MDKITAIETIPHVDKEYQDAIDRYLLEMERLNDQMADRQRRIQKLQAETHAILADLKVA